MQFQKPHEQKWLLLDIEEIIYKQFILFYNCDIKILEQGADTNVQILFKEG